MRRRSKIITVVVSAIITYAAGVLIAGNVYGYRNCGYHHGYHRHHWHHQATNEKEKSGEKNSSPDSTQQNDY
jgi:hypothetical protein